MTLFVTTTDPVTKEILSPENAQLIYESMKAWKSHTDLFKEWVSFDDSKKVSDDMERLEREINVIMNWNKEKTQAIYSEPDEMGDRTLITPSTYEDPATQKDLVALVSSELLDVAVLVDDVRIYSDGNPDQDPDFTTRKESFTSDII